MNAFAALIAFGLAYWFFDGLFAWICMTSAPMGQN